MPANACHILSGWYDVIRLGDGLGWAVVRYLEHKWVRNGHAGVEVHVESFRYSFGPNINIFI